LILEYFFRAANLRVGWKEKIRLFGREFVNEVGITIAYAVAK